MKKDMRCFMTTKENQDYQIDLHLHTTASDGTWTQEELLEEILNSQIKAFSVTDHDTYVNSMAMQAYLQVHLPEKLQFIMGAECSSTYEGKEYHITAYDFDHRDPDLNRLLAFNQEQRAEFNFKTVLHVKEARALEDISDYHAYTYDRRRGGWGALNYLLDRHLIKDASEYFQMIQVLNDQLVFKHPQEVIQTIKKAGGYAFLAHPAAYQRGELLSKETLDQWKFFGIDGIECYSPYLKQLEDAEYYKAYCREQGLMMSGGSDCHGSFTTRPLGVPKVMRSQVRLDFLD